MEFYSYFNLILQLYMSTYNSTVGNGANPSILIRKWIVHHLTIRMSKNC